MSRWFAALAAAALACGDGGGGSPQRLDGTWTSSDAEHECTWVLNFDGDYMEHKEVCVLGDDSVAIEIYSATFSAADSRLTLELRASSCEQPKLQGAAQYRFVDDALQLVVGGSVRIYERDGPIVGGHANSAAFGCFTDDGVFEPREPTEI